MNFKVNRNILLTLLFIVFCTAGAYAQATTRTVTGTVRKATGAAWPSATLTFKLDKSTYTSTSQFPADAVTATTGLDGTFSVALWCNAEGQIQTKYTATLPDASSFSFRLEAGAGSIELAVLRAAGTSVTSPGTSTYAVLETLIASHAAASDPHPVYLTQVEGDARYAAVGSVGSDHGALTGLADDDHTQYFNTARGDARYSLLGHTHVVADVTSLQTLLDAKAAAASLSAHIADTANPHTVTKTQVGLSNVDNSSDANKPVSTAQATAIDAASTTDRARANHTGTQAVSTVTGLQAALDGKQATLGYMPLNPASNLSDVANPGTSRTSLGLGTAATLNVPASGDAASGEVVKGSDTRLSDARPPTTHIHAESDVTNLVTDLAAKQAGDSDLTAIAAIAPSNDDVLQRKAGAWTNRTPAQLKTDLVLVKGDVGLANVDNTSDATKNVASVTLTNKTFALGSNTLTGTTAQFNTSLTDGDFATLAGTETLTNKTLTSPAITTPTGIVKGDVGLGNVDNTSDATKNTATVTLTNKTAALGSNTITGTTAQFNTALTDNDFATLAGAETLTNKTLTTPTVASFTNAAHTHQNAAGGGTLDTAAITGGTINPARLGSGTASSATVLYGDNVWRGAGEQLLVTATIDLDNDNAQIIYTVPPGKTLIVTRWIMRSASVDLVGQGTSASLTRSTDGADISSTVDMNQLATPSNFYNALTDSGSNVYVSTPAGATVRVRPSAVFGAPASSVVDLFGYLY